MDFQREKLYKEIISNNEILEIIEKESLTKNIIDRDFLTLCAFCINSKKCINCKGLDSCLQDSVGMKPQINYSVQFVTEYVPCKYLQDIRNLAEKKNNLTTLACNLDNVQYNNLFNNQIRTELYRKMLTIYDRFVNGQSTKGIYLYGPYGCGKSYIMACFADKYAESGYKVVFAYFPELVRLLKSSIGDGSLEKNISVLKDADVLILDDFGGELQSSFIRDEVIGTVLQDRMVNNSLTFFTSNLDDASLHEHLAETSKSVDDVRATRIEERIRALTEKYFLKDINYRN